MDRGPAGQRGASGGLYLPQNQSLNFLPNRSYSVFDLFREFKHVRDTLLWGPNKHAVAEVEDVLLVPSLGYRVPHSRLDSIL